MYKFTPSEWEHIEYLKVGGCCSFLDRLARHDRRRCSTADSAIQAFVSRLTKPLLILDFSEKPILCESLLESLIEVGQRNCVFIAIIGLDTPWKRYLLKVGGDKVDDLRFFTTIYEVHEDPILEGFLKTHSKKKVPSCPDYGIAFLQTGG